MVELNDVQTKRNKIKAGNDMKKIESKQSPKPNLKEVKKLKQH